MTELEELRAFVRRRRTLLDDREHLARLRALADAAFDAGHPPHDVVAAGRLVDAPGRHPAGEVHGPCSVPNAYGCVCAVCAATPVRGDGPGWLRVARTARRTQSELPAGVMRSIVLQRLAQAVTEATNAGADERAIGYVGTRHVATVATADLAAVIDGLDADMVALASTRERIGATVRALGDLIEQVPGDVPASVIAVASEARDRAGAELR